MIRGDVVKIASVFVLGIVIIGSMAISGFGTNKTPSLLPQQLRLQPGKALSLVRVLDRASQVVLPEAFLKNRVIFDSTQSLAHLAVGSAVRVVDASNNGKMLSSRNQNRFLALLVPLQTVPGKNYVFELETRSAGVKQTQYKTLILALPLNKKSIFHRTRPIVVPYDSVLLSSLLPLKLDNFPVTSEVNEECHLPGFEATADGHPISCQIGRMNLIATDHARKFYRMSSQFASQGEVRYVSLSVFDTAGSQVEVREPLFYTVTGSASIVGNSRFPNLADHWVFSHPSGFLESTLGLKLPTGSHFHFTIQVPVSGETRFQSSVGYINGAWQEPSLGIEESFPKGFATTLNISCVGGTSSIHSTEVYRDEGLEKLKSRPKLIDERIPSGCAGQSIEIDFRVSATEHGKESLVFLSQPTLVNVSQSNVRRNLIFITADAMRADHTGFGGYAGSTTPSLDQIAKLGVTFEQHFTMRSMTQTSLPSIFSGLAPYSIDEEFPRGRKGFLYSNKRIDGLPSRLMNEGYQVFASVGAQFFGKFGSGIENFDEIYFPGSSEDRERLVVASRWLASRDRRRPFFLWVHVRRPHIPYNPEPLYRIVQNSKKERQNGFSEEDRIRMLHKVGFRTDQERLGLIRDLYDSNIRQVDGEIVSTLKQWEAQGFLEDTVVSISSDHGENLGEHDQYFQHGTLENASLHVPWIILDPLKISPGSHVRSITQTIDFYPTILNLLGISIPPGIDGHAILFDSKNENSETPAIQYAFADFHSQIFAVQDSRWKYVSNPNLYSFEGLNFPKSYSHEKEELFDLLDDPHESRNVIVKHPLEATRLREILKTEYMAHFSTSEKPEFTLNSEVLDLLKRAGYVQFESRGKSSGQ